MRTLKFILARFLAFWAALVFVSTMLLALIPIVLVGFAKEPRRSRLFQTVIQVWMTVFFVLTGVRRSFRGREHFKKGENYVVVCNHRSYLDPPLSSPGIPTANKTIAKAEMAKIPLFGIVYRFGSVLVDRKNEESRKASYNKMKDVLVNQGFHMCIYPEGTRNRSADTLLRFHDGAFKLAVETGKSVIPSLLFNSGKVMPPSEGFYFWPQHVAMHFLPPVPPAGKSVAELRDEVHALMKDYLETHQP